MTIVPGGSFGLSDFALPASLSLSLALSLAGSPVFSGSGFLMPVVSGGLCAIATIARPLSSIAGNTKRCTGRVIAVRPLKTDAVVGKGKKPETEHRQCGQPLVIINHRTRKPRLESPVCPGWR